MKTKRFYIIEEFKKKNQIKNTLKKMNLKFKCKLI